MIDLGKDVPPEEIVETAIKEDVRLVGLSALMTTTVVSMEETIRQLREKKPECKVMVGGAVLNQDYSDMIGADFYGKMRCSPFIMHNNYLEERNRHEFNFTRKLRSTHDRARDTGGN